MVFLSGDLLFTPQGQSGRYLRKMSVRDYPTFLLHMFPQELLIRAIKIYQQVFSPDRGLLKYLYPNNNGHCRMYPSCSEYMILSVQKHGAFRGVFRGTKRVFRCHPFQKQFIDLP